MTKLHEENLTSSSREEEVRGKNTASAG